MRKALLLVGGPSLFFFVFTSCQSAEELKKEQYFAEGYQLYTSHCSNCHQPDGKGMANLYPPINQKEFLPDNQQLFACIVKNGTSGEITIDGRKFNRPMPANPKLTTIEIAEIATYVYNKWGGDSTYMKIDSVNHALLRCVTEKIKM